jgi:hypothetical protein
MERQRSGNIWSDAGYTARWIEIQPLAGNLRPMGRYGRVAELSHVKREVAKPVQA